MRVVYSPTHALHDPQYDVQAGVAIPHVEQPARIEAIRAMLAADARFTLEAPTEHGAAPIAAVHAPGLIAFLEEAWQVWRAAAASEPAMIPDTMLHPGLRAGMGEPSVEPTTPIGRLGYWGFDTGTPILPGTYAAARAAVDVSLSAADLVLGGQSVAYGLCRPPGHHAAHAAYGGFCFFNNAAITAEYLVQHTRDRVTVLDVDYHHGNGTQQIFYHRGDVQFLSLHADPLHAYPFFTGHADEVGAGSGRGANLNIPLPPQSTDVQYLNALDRLLAALADFRPAITVVSLGLDTYARDPLGDFSLTTYIYGEIGHRVASAAGRLVILQEGGYFLPELGENARQWLLGAQSSKSEVSVTRP